MRIPHDVIMQIDDSGYWILYNVFTQTTLAVCDNTMLLLRQVQKGLTNDEVVNYFLEKKFAVIKVGVFSTFAGLLADPTRRIRNVEQWPQEQIYDVTAIVGLLEDNQIIIMDEEKYASIFKPKTSLLDTENVGNFHQQLGHQLLIKNRVDPSEWWIQQKFNPEKNDLNDNLYKSIQENFLKSFFASKYDASHKVLDLGCGIGYYSNMMAQAGAEVLGVDPNADYIEIAKTHFKGSNLSFKVSEIGLNTNSTSWIETHSFDFIFMSDALLFYFVSPDPKQQASIDILLSEIKRILKPNGRFFSLEPHGIFWLRPWLGEEERPFTVITEHRNKLFNVAPNNQDLIKAYSDGGFVLKEMQELYADVSLIKKDKRAEQFATEFPLWCFFELESPIDRGV